MDRTTSFSDYVAAKLEKMAADWRPELHKGKEFKPSEHKYKAVRDFVREWIATEELSAEIPTELLNALKDTYARPAGKGNREPRGSRATLKSRFFELFDEIGAGVHELEIFRLLKIGVRECSAIVREGLMNQLPENRHWISYNEETGIYRLENVGEDVPDGWMGFVPVKKVSEIPDEENEVDKVGETLHTIELD